MPMSRIVVVVEFEVKPEHRSQFIELINGHAQRSRAEDGCQQFDMLLPQEDQNRVFLVGAWRDPAALDATRRDRWWQRRRRLTNHGWSAVGRRAVLQTEVAIARQSLAEGSGIVSGNLSLIKSVDRCLHPGRLGCCRSFRPP
jgi:quinol monooxygenase YgiN